MRHVAFQRRQIVTGLLGAAVAGPAVAQTSDPPAPRLIGPVTEFDIAGGKFIRLEHEPASNRLRSGEGYLRVRFQIEQPYFDETWIPILGFSMLDASGDNAIKLDFADLPVTEHMIVAADRATRSTRASETLMKIHVPGFKHGEVHAFDLGIAENAVEFAINGYRRSLKRDFEIHNLIIRPSGVKGWVAFPTPGDV